MRGTRWVVGASSASSVRAIAADAAFFRARLAAPARSTTGVCRGRCRTWREAILRVEIASPLITSTHQGRAP